MSPPRMILTHRMLSTATTHNIKLCCEEIGEESTHWHWIIVLVNIQNGNGMEALRDPVTLMPGLVTTVETIILRIEFCEDRNI